MAKTDTIGMSRSKYGVIASLAASALFGAVFFISGSLGEETDTETVVSWRVIITSAVYALALSHPVARQAFREIWSKIRSASYMPLVFVVLCFLAILQLWLFAWAPMNGHALDASLGYLLLPIFLVIAGRVVFAAPVPPLQWLAVFIAVIAIVVKLSFGASISWVTLAIAGGYALYFTIRRRFGLDGPVAHGIEVTVFVPVAIFLLFTGTGRLSEGTTLVVILAGFAGALGMICYLAASNMLSMPVFGLLSYGEPLLLFVASLLLGEMLSPGDGIVYGLLALALAVLGYNGFQTSRTSRKARKAQPESLISPS